MSRASALVDADWVEAPSRRPEGRPRRGRRGHHRLRQGPHPPAPSARLEDRPAGPGPPRLRQQGAVRGAAVRQGHRQRRHRRALRRQQQLVRRLRLLVLQALRPRRRPAARRRPQEVGARQPRADRRGRRRARRPRTPPRSRTLASARSATRSSARSARRTWSTCARPTSSPAGCSPRRTCRRSSRSAPVTSRPRANIPWSQGGQRRRHVPQRRRADASSTPTRASTSAKDTIAYCRIGERSRAHLVRAARAARPAEREELRRLVDRVRLAGRRADRSSATSQVTPDVRRDARAGCRTRGRRRDQGGGHPGRRRRATASRSAAAYVRLLDCVGRVHRRGADVGDRAVPVLRRARRRGRCARWRPGPTPVDRGRSPSRASSPRSPSRSESRLGRRPRAASPGCPGPRRVLQAPFRLGAPLAPSDRRCGGQDAVAPKGRAVD